MRALHVFAGLVVFASSLAVIAACSDNSATSTPQAGTSSSTSSSSSSGSSGDEEGGASSSTSSSSSSSTSSSSSSGSLDAGADAARDFSTDTTKFYGPTSRCAQANVKLCEDFESGTLDATKWTVNGDVPKIETGQHARGAKALHITKTGNGISSLVNTSTFPAKNNTYFGRAFVRFEKLPAPPMPGAHWTFIASSAKNVPGEIRVSGMLQGAVNHFGVGTDNSSDGGTGDWNTTDNDPKNAPKAVPTGTWMCIEWMHKGDAASETRFYWDDVEHPSMYTTKTMHGGNANPYILPQMTQFFIGWDEYQASTEPFEMWLDEIAIDDARIGCVL